MNDPEPIVPPASQASGLWSTRGLQDLALLGLTIAGLVLCFLIARPFVGALAWAVALTVVAWPLHRQVARRVPWPSAAAACSVGAITLLLILPSALIVPGVVAEALAGYEAVKTHIESDAWTTTLDRHAWIAAIWDWLRQRIDLGDVLQRAGTALTAIGSFAVKTSFVGTVELVLTLFFLFYFLRDRQAIVASLRAWLPLTAPEADRILSTARDTILATVYGKVLVGMVQGVLGGLMFWWLGLPAAWFWAIVMGVLSIFPLLGPPLVWLPAAILLLLDGQLLQALILVGWGAAVVGLADNVLYPVVVGRYLRLHTVPLLVALIGGVLVFGTVGFFLGPLVLAVTLAVLGVWSDRSPPLSAGADG